MEGLNKKHAATMTEENFLKAMDHFKEDHDLKKIYADNKAEVKAAEVKKAESKK